MKQLQIDEQKARSRYQSASPELKEILEDTFGKEFFSQNVIDRIQSYEDVCSEDGKEAMNEKEMLKLGFRQKEIDQRKLEEIIKKYNEGWEPDFSDNSQQKWRVWLTYDASSPGGFRFDDSLYAYSLATAGFASRLYLKNERLAKLIWERFPDLCLSITNG